VVATNTGPPLQHEKDKVRGAGGRDVLQCVFAHASEGSLRFQLF